MKKEQWPRLLDLLCAGLPAKKIATILRKDKGDVSRMIKVLSDLGYVVCENPNDRVRFYLATAKKFSPGDEVLLSTYFQEKRRKNDQRGCFIDCHALAYTARIKAIGGEVSWDDRWETRGCTHSILRYPFNDIGSVTFHRIQGQYSDTLRVNFSHIKWNINRGSPERYLGNIARKVMGWFEGEYGAQLSHLRKCSGDHYSIPVRHPHLIELAQESTVTVGDTFQLDASPPERVPHIESMRGFDPLRQVLNAPDRITSLEGRVTVLERKMDQMCKVLAEVVPTIHEMKDELQAIRKDLTYVPAKAIGEQRECDWS